MKFTENKFRLIPNVSRAAFSFSDLYLSNTTGVAEIGLSGNGNKLSFLFESGNIYDSAGMLIKSFADNERINVSGDSQSDSYRYFINNELYRQAAKNNYDFEKLFVNVTGTELSANIKLQAEITDIDYTVTVDSSLTAGDSLSGRVTNNTPNKFRLFKPSYLFLENTSPSFSGEFSGDVAGNSYIDFFLPDLNSDYGDSSINFDMFLDLSIGSDSVSKRVLRRSYVTGDINVTDYSSFSNKSVNFKMKGNGSPNEFVFSKDHDNRSGEICRVFCSSVFDRRGHEKVKQIKYHIKPVTPATVTGTGNFLTGFNNINSGHFSEVPDYYVTSFSSIDSINYNSNNLFSEGCGTSIPVTFSPASGYGASGSGTALLKKTRISLFGSQTFYTVTGYTATNQGSGYNYDPTINVLTGDAGATCFDVIKNSGSAYIYEEFAGSGVRTPVADYAHGVLLTGESIIAVSGASYTGYAITGIQFTNMGSGYIESSGYTPELVITRKATDTGFDSILVSSGLNHSGSFIFNHSGDGYSFSDNWTFRTGVDATGMTTIDTGTIISNSSGYSGIVEVPGDGSCLHIFPSFDQPSLTQDYQISITLEYSGLSNNTGVSSVITAVNQHPSGTGEFWTEPFIEGDTNLISF